jgi:hypothetical protein
MSIERQIRAYGGQPLTQSILQDILSDYRWPHNKINDLVQQKVLEPVRRGLYVTGPEFDLPRPSPYLLANHIYGPSYVSAEAALAFHGLIPENVVTTTSITTGLAKDFRTPQGRFTYMHSRLPFYSFGITQVSVGEKQRVLMASPEKALCDKIVTTKSLLLRSMHQTEAFLLDDMRIDKEAIPAFNTAAISSWLNDAPKKDSLHMLVKTIAHL